MSVSNVNLMQIKSTSNARFAGHDDGMTYVVFSRDDGEQAYAYEDPDGSLFRELRQAPSKGRYINEHLVPLPCVKCKGTISVNPEPQNNVIMYANDADSVFRALANLEAQVEKAMERGARFDDAIIVMSNQLPPELVDEVRDAFDLSHEELRVSSTRSPGFWFGIPGQFIGHYSPGEFVPGKNVAGTAKPEGKVLSASKPAANIKAEPPPVPANTKSPPKQTVTKKATTPMGRSDNGRTQWRSPVDTDSWEAHVRALIGATAKLAEKLGVPPSEINLHLSYDVPQLRKTLMDAGFTIDSSKGQPPPRNVGVSAPSKAEG